MPFGWPPALIIAIVLLAGVYFLPINLISIIGLAVTGIILLSTGIFLLLKKHDSSARLFFAVSLGVLIGIIPNLGKLLILGSTFTGLPVEQISAFSGVLLEDSSVTQSGITVQKMCLDQVSADKNELKSGAFGYVLIYDQSARYYFAGQILRVEGNLKPHNVALPFLFTSSAKNINAHGFSSDFLEFRAGLIGRLTAQIDKMGYPAAGLFQALFLGKRHKITATDYALFENSGTLHLLALSGLHVSIIFVLISLVISRLPSKIFQWIIGSTLVLGYLFLVGFKPSLLRASLMLILAGLNILLQKELRPLNILSLALILVVVIDPLSPDSLSFKLSFGGLAGIILLSPALIRFFKPYMPIMINGPLAVSIGAQAATMPIILYSFGRYRPIGILATLVIALPLTLFIWGGLAFLVAALLPLPALVSFLGRVLNLLYYLIMQILDFFTFFPEINLAKTYWQWIFLAGGFGLCYLFHFLQKQRIRKKLIES